MGLTLLVPAALGLFGLVILPIIAHISLQSPREKVPFGATLLLERVVKRLRRRRRIRDPLLFLLRAMAVLLLVLAVAGLQWRDEALNPAFGRSGRVVLLVDQSMSMSTNDGVTLLARARQKALDQLDELRSGTLIGVVAFGAEARRLTPTLTSDLAGAAQRIESIEPTYETSNLRAALLEARRLLGGEVGEVVLYSDEAGPQIVRGAVEELDLLVRGGSVLIAETTSVETPRNVAVTRATYGDGIEGGRVTLEVTNFSASSVEIACEVALPDGQKVPIFVNLPPNGAAEEQITVPPEALGGVGVASCDDPDLLLDNARYFHLPRVGASRVLVVDGDPGDTPIRSEVYFLERALAPWGGLRTGVMPDVISPVRLGSLDPEEHRVVFLANVADPRAYGPRLTDFVRKGGSLVISAGENVTADRYNAALGSLLPVPLRKPAALAAMGEPGIPLELPSLDEPLFAAFERSGRAAFKKVRSRRVMTVEPYTDTTDVSTLLRYEGGIPALLERRVGSGRVLFWTSTVDVSWSNLPLQAAFMPLVQGVVSYLGAESGGGAARFEALVGETVRIPLPDLAIEPDVMGPGEQLVKSRVESSELVFTPTSPGAYTLVVESAPPLAFVAVNTDPVESDIRAVESVRAEQKALAPERYARLTDLSPFLFGLALLALLLQALWSLRGTSA